MPHFMVHLIPSHEATNDYQPPVVTIGINDRLTIAKKKNVQGLHQIATPLQKERSMIFCRQNTFDMI